MHDGIANKRFPCNSVKGNNGGFRGGGHKIMIFAIYNSIMIFFHEAHRNNLLIRSNIRVITHRCSRTLPWVVSNIGHILGRRVDSPAAIPWSSCSADRQTARSRQGHFDADLVNSLRPGEPQMASKNLVNTGSDNELSVPRNYLDHCWRLSIVYSGTNSSEIGIK